MGRTEILTRTDYERALVGMATYSHESEMALFHECTLQCAQKELDTADIVRDGDFSPATKICPMPSQAMFTSVDYREWVDKLLQFAG